MEEILKILNDNLKLEIINKCAVSYIAEIRMRINRNIIVEEMYEEKVLDYICNFKDIQNILLRVSNNSIYAIEENLKEGFITMKGGHRIGICGKVITEDKKILSVSDINSLNIRVANERKGVSNTVMRYILNERGVNNTLIISPPGKGKTTLLRDISRNISNGFDKFKGLNIGIVDERGELAAVHDGIPELDVGLRSDVITGVSKAKGIEMLIRCMGIRVIITDEIYLKEDVEAIKRAISSGISGIFTMHAEDLNDALRNENIAELIEAGVFRNIIVLSKSEKGKIERVHIIKANNEEVA